jgi:thioredoxin reductase (NADPH)
MYDILIIGAGPAGLSASIYASRFGLKNVIIGAVTGGLASTSHEIGNWPGTIKIPGFELSEQMVDHVKSYGATIIERIATSIKKIDGGFEISIANHEPIQGKALLLALGTHHRHLGVPGESELVGKGVSYCATCDGFFYKNKTVAVVGGHDSAAGAAVYLGDIAKKVYIIYRKEPLHAEAFWLKAIAENPKIETIFNTHVTKINGDAKLKSVTLDREIEGSTELPIDGLFIEVGSEPNVQLVRELGVAVDDGGFVIINQDGTTNVDGIWAAGDSTTGSNKFRQIVTAAAEGAIAAASIQKYLKTLNS